MQRLVLLLSACCLCLPALESGKDLLLDKAVADQFPKEVRSMVYAVLTDLEREQKAMAAGPASTLEVTPIDAVQAWRLLIIQGQCSVAEVREALRRSKLTPAQREAEQAQFLDELRKQRQEREAGTAKP